MSERIAVINFDLGEEINRRIEGEFPQFRFHIQRKGGEALSEEVLANAEVVCGYLNKPGYIRQAKNARFIHALSAGVDGFLGDVAEDVAVSNAAGAYSVVLGEHVLALVLALARRIDSSMRNMCGAREWKFQHVRGGIHGANVAILGAGDIGGYVANAMRALGANRITGYKLHPAEAKPPYDAMFAGEDRLHAAMAGADYVIICLPGTPFTKNLIGREAIAAMKPGCTLINIGRGNIVDTEAMLAALQSGHLAAAGLDVTEPEPLPPEHPLWDMENVIITTHYAGWSASKDALADWFIENFHAYLEGRPLPGAVDRVWKY